MPVHVCVYTRVGVRVHASEDACIPACIINRGQALESACVAAWS